MIIACFPAVTEVLLRPPKNSANLFSPSRFLGKHFMIDKIVLLVLSWLLRMLEVSWFENIYTCGPGIGHIAGPRSQK